MIQKPMSTLSLWVERILGPLRPVAVTLFVALVPVFLLTANVRLVVNWPSLYSRGFDKYEREIAAYVEIERGEYLLAGRAIRDYFNNDATYIDIRAVVGGVRIPLFNQREILHMSDVKGLLRGVYRIGEVAALYLAAFAMVALVLSGRRFPAMLGRYLGAGGLVTIGVLLAVGLAALVGFDRLFLAFHLVSFSNDLWQLDPRDDNLIAMFPQGFFFDATILIAVLTIAEGLVLAGILLAMRAWRSPSGRRRTASPA